MLEQYEILFGEKKKQLQQAAKEAAAEPSNTFSMGHPSQGPHATGSNSQYADRMMHSSNGGSNNSLGLTNDPDRYMLPPSGRAGSAGNNSGQKKRVHRGFQQLLQKDQLSYIPPSLPLYQNQVRLCCFMYPQHIDLFVNTLDGCAQRCSSSSHDVSITKPTKPFRYPSFTHHKYAASARLWKSTTCSEYVWLASSHDGTRATSRPSPWRKE